MSYFQWDDAYSVCVDRLDHDHKHLFDLLNKAYDASSRSLQTKNYPVIVSELLDYLRHHFVVEENYMNQIKYPNVAAHKLEHQRFYNQALAYQQKGYENKEDYTQDLQELVEAIFNWLHQHILSIDQQYTNFVVLSYFK